MAVRPVLAVAVAALMASLSGCAWWEGVTGQTEAVVPAQGAANFNNMMTAIGNEPRETRQLADLGTVSTDKVVIANVDMIARGGSGRQLDQAMHDNARSIEDLRRQVERNAALKRVLGEQHVPVNNVVALDVTRGGGVVVYALPPVQTGLVPPPADSGPHSTAANPGNPPPQ